MTSWRVRYADAEVSRQGTVKITYRNTFGNMIEQKDYPNMDDAQTDILEKIRHQKSDIQVNMI